MNENQRRPCSTKTKGATCGHEPESHYPERVSSPDGVPRVHYRACLAAFCDCDGYQAPPKETP